MVSAAGILGLAYVVGISTERLGALAGPQVGGILNATFGNIAELIIAFFALTAGQLDGRQGVASPAPSSATCCWCWAPACSSAACATAPSASARKVAGLDSTLLVLAVIGLFVPAVFAFSQGAVEGAGHRIEESVVISVVLLALYFVNLFYRFRHTRKTMRRPCSVHLLVQHIADGPDDVPVRARY